MLRNPFLWGPLLALAGLVALLVGPERLKQRRGFPASCARRGPIELVPMGSTQAGKWTAQFVERYRVPITISTAMALPPEAFDRGRRQYVAEKLVGAANAERRRPGDDRLLVLVLDEDMNIAHVPSWRWAFAMSDQRTSVVSLHHMGLASADELPDRFAKMLARHLGGEYCGFERTGPRESVMRRADVLA